MVGDAFGVVAVEELPKLDTVARIKEIKINLAEGNGATGVCKVGEAYSVVDGELLGIRNRNAFEPKAAHRVEGNIGIDSSRLHLCLVVERAPHRFV